MKRKLTFWEKVKVFKAWIDKLDGFGLIGSCNICDSIKLDRLEYKEDGLVYTAAYICMDCGAKAGAVEVWEPKIEEV